MTIMQVCLYLHRVQVVSFFYKKYLYLDRMANEAIAIPEKLTADQLREFNARKIKKPKQDDAAKVLIRKRKRASAKSKSTSKDNGVTIKSLKPLEPLYETPTERAAGFQQSKGSRLTGSRRDGEYMRAV